MKTIVRVLNYLHIFIFFIQAVDLIKVINIYSSNRDSKYFNYCKKVLKVSELRAGNALLVKVLKQLVQVLICWRNKYLLGKDH